RNERLTTIPDRSPGKEMPGASCELDAGPQGKYQTMSLINERASARNKISDELDRSTSENNVSANDVKFTPAQRRKEFAKHRGNRMSLSVMKRHPPHLVRAAGRRASPSTKAAVPNWRDQLDPNPLNWRDQLAVHPAAEAFPLLSEQDLLGLAGDIKRNGLK